MQYQSINVKCPYYITHDKKSIKCEAEFGNFVKHSFANSAEQIEHLHCFCYNNYKNCPLAKNIEKKYVSG